MEINQFITMTLIICTLEAEITTNEAQKIEPIMILKFKLAVAGEMDQCCPGNISSARLTFFS